MAVIIKGIDILEPSAGTNSLQWAWQNGGPVSGEVLIFGENGLLTNGTPVIPETTSFEVTEFYPSDMYAADNLSNYPGFTNAMFFDGSSYLSRSLSSTSTFTISLWAKASGGSSDYLFKSGTDVGLNWITPNSDGRMYMHSANVDVGYGERYRDISAWYHIVLQSNSGNSRFWVNNRAATTDGTTVATRTSFTFTGTTYIGCLSTAAPNFNGYMANIQFIDGQALDASYFGQYLMDVDGNPTDAWAPKLFDGKSSTGGADVTNDYGTNGFLLDFSKLGLDGSGDIDKVYDTAPISGSHSAANDWTAH